MAVTSCDNINQTLTKLCNCYKVASLVETILDATEVSNLKDHYILGEQLGLGQFGVIRECSDKSTGEVLACKSIAKDRLVTLNDVRSVKLEIEIMTRLSGHPNVVDLKAVYEEEDYVHLVMELCAGGELFHRLEKQGRFSEFEARMIFTHLMQVVKFCHDNGIVHRDLKPENILLATRSSSSPIKLADFGLATYIQPGQSLCGTVGSPFYIAPEVLSGGYDQAADIWSAGVILYILLSGRPPFGGKTKSRIFDAVRAANLWFHSDPWDRISASAKELITGMLHVNPSKRLTAAEVLDHSWMKDCGEAAEVPFELDSLTCRQQDTSGGAFSITGIARDYSFGDGSPTPVDDQPWQSPAFTCKSSFSSFRVENGTPTSAHGGFSFSSCCEADFSSPVPSMPSFTFFSPSSAIERGDIVSGFKANMSTMDAIHGETNSGKLFTSSDTPSLAVNTDHRIETRRGGTGGSRNFSSIHSKRNHTIGLGELEQLDIIVTESVIRWASCTNISTASSLESSLVCLKNGQTQLLIAGG